MEKAIYRRDFCKIIGTAALGCSLMPFIPKAAFGAGSLDKGYVHLGCSLPLTGTYSKVANMYKDAYEFYLETVNRKISVAGKEYGLKLTMYDDENKPPKTAQLTEKLFFSDKVDLLLSSYGTDPVLAQASVCKKYNKVMINGGAATRKIDEEFAGTVFTLIPTGDAYHKTLLEMVSKLNPPIRRAGIITPDDAIYHEIADAVKSQCKQYGIETLEDVIPMDASDLTGTVVKMKQYQAEMIVNTGWDKILDSFVRQAQKYGLELKFLDGGHATVTPFLEKSLGKSLNNICGVTFFMPEARTKDIYHGDSMGFSEKYTKKFGYSPGYHAAMAYQIPVLYELLLKDADPADPFNVERMKTMLFAMDQDMIWGRIKFNSKGRIEKNMLVIQWQGDPPKPVIVFPEENATGKLNYPSNPIGG